MFDNVDTTPLYDSVLTPLLMLTVYILVAGLVGMLILRIMPIPKRTKGTLINAICLVGGLAWAKYYMGFI